MLFGIKGKNRLSYRAVNSKGGAVALATADDTVVGNETLTTTQMLAGVLTRDPNGAARTDTTPTGTLIDTAFPGLQVNEYITFIIINTADAAEAITIAGGTGVTINNAGQTIAQNESAILLFKKTGAATYTVYIVGA